MKTKLFTFIIMFTLVFAPVCFAVESQFQVELEVLASTSTPDEEEEDDGDTKGSTVLAIYDLIVEQKETSAVITWKTYQPTQNTFYSGTTRQYNDEIIKETTFSTTHQIVLSNLKPATFYYFNIEAVNEDGKMVTRADSFKTQGIAEGIPTVTNFTARATTNAINLSWKNPKDFAGREVRVMRSEVFFPTDHLDGVAVYQGKAEKFVDTKVEIGKTYYYSIFVKDASGNYSSGVVAQATVGTIVGESEVIPDVYDSLPKAPAVHPVIAALNFWDFDFIQDGVKINDALFETIAVDGTKNLTISIPYDKIPEVLKSIIVTLRDPEDPKRVFTFILNVNKEKTLYTATIGPLERSGAYETRIAIVDYKNRGLKATDGVVSVQTAIAQSAGLNSGSQSLWILLVLALIAFGARQIEKVFADRKRGQILEPAQ